MPLTPKGEKIMASMKKEYGPDAKSVFYASANKGTIKGIHKGKKMTKKHQIAAVKSKMK